MHVIEEVGLNAVLGEDARRFFGEETGISARIVGDDDPFRLFCRRERLDVLGKSLRRAHDGIDVHHVHAAAENAAHARRAEGKFSAEAVLLLLLVPRDGLKFRSVRFRQAGIGEPCLVDALITHIFHSLLLSARRFPRAADFVIDCPHCGRNPPH